MAQAPAFSASSGATTLLGASGQDEFLHPDKAFQLTARAIGPDQLQLSWVIAPGYYLYRDRTRFASETPGMTLGRPVFPEGETKTDEFFGTQVVFRELLDVNLAVSRNAERAEGIDLQVTYQGCADAGLCYPPQKKLLSVELPVGSATGGSAIGGSAAGGAAVRGAGGVSGPSSADNAADGGPAVFVSEQDRLALLIRDGNLWVMLGVFFVIGLGLSYTPCCLPMVPILSALIAGQGKQVSAGRAFGLSLAYVLGMALTYTAAGAATAAAGSQAQALFQQPWIILLFAALFIAMALSMFGLFTVQIPAFLQTRLSLASGRQQAGTYGGVAVMGALSSLIVTACIAPAMVASLVTIGQGGAIGRGAAALFVMAIGMGTPLLLVGASQGRLLPKAGPWMDGIKQLFGVMMLAVAAWMLSRLLAVHWSLLLYALAALAGTVVLWRFGARGWGRALARGAALLCALYASMLVYGATAGSKDPLQPWLTASHVTELEFQAINSVSELDAALAAANATGQNLMLDFYADWCASCKEMERYTFTSKSVHAALANTVLLRADVTGNTLEHQILLKRFGIYGPPTIAFFSAGGLERTEYRVIGYMKASAFAEHTRMALGSGTPPGD